MDTYIPKSKLSKKKQRELNKAKRNVWYVNPITRTVESRKVYKRSKFKKIEY